MILDGWGIGNAGPENAIYSANTPFIDSLDRKVPKSTLKTYGEHVGLPEGQMGNSEVGHMNIGAGRIVYQDLVKINKAVETGSFFEEKVLLEAMDYAKTNGKAIHLMGLVSDGGVHSSQGHLHALLDLCANRNFDNVYVHAFTDGRDCDPNSGLQFLQELQRQMDKSTGRLASVVGRYFAMDRDKRWERVKKAYDLLVNGKGESFENGSKAIESSYAKGVTDEFIEPSLILDEKGNAVRRIEESDVVICFNFRTDRCREITQALTQQNFPDHGMKKMDLHYITMTRYDDSFKGVRVIYQKDNLEMTLGEVLSNASKSQVRIAETEKYPHVTFFFSGGREKEFEGEKRIMINSPKVPTYDLQPEMSANEVTEAIIKEINKAQPDFICLNFANPDMVGHTGVYDAIVKACETVDACANKVVDACQENGYDILITADHGNADYAINEDGSPNTAHTTNPVPLYYVGEDYGNIQDGILADLAPTILEIMRLDQPQQMTGKSLL